MTTCDPQDVLGPKLLTILNDFNVAYANVQDKIPRSSASYYGSPYSIIGSLGIHATTLELQLDPINKVFATSIGCGANDYMYCQIPITLTSATALFNAEIRTNGFGRHWPPVDPNVNNLEAIISGNMLIIVPISESRIDFTKIKVDTTLVGVWTFNDSQLPVHTNSMDSILRQSVPFQEVLNAYVKTFNRHLQNTVCKLLTLQLQSKQALLLCNPESTMAQQTWPADYTNNFAHLPCSPCDSECICALQSRCDGDCAKSPTVSCTISNSWTITQLIGTILLVFVAVCFALSWFT